VVPNQYATIQAAVDAASPGDVVAIGPGVYREELSIAKDISLVGAGPRLTVIHAPAALVAQAEGRANIVEIRGGARVAIRDLSISGPGPTLCQAGSLFSGIRVIEGATLDLSSARVTHIHDATKADCNHSGTAINIGSFLDGEVGHARIHDVVVADYQANGIAVFEPGSDLAVTGSVIDARVGAADVVDPGGVEIADGAVGVVRHNVVVGNRCNSPSLGCGPDPINDFQAAGVFNGPGLPPAPGTQIDDNMISGNDIGIYLSFADNCCRITGNRIKNNLDFGVALQDETQTLSQDVISGGRVGVAVVADAADALGTLDDERIFGTTVASTQGIECCGYTATIHVESELHHRHATRRDAQRIRFTSS
jgi:parallel beta-helix repeat protein